MDLRPFKPLLQGNNPATGQTWVIHEGQAIPGQWTHYYLDSHPLAVEILRLRRLESEVPRQAVDLSRAILRPGGSHA